MNSNTSPPIAGDPGPEKTRVQIDDDLIDGWGIYLSELRAFAQEQKSFALSNLKVFFAMEAIEGKKLLKYMVANNLATSYFRDPQTRYRPTEFLLSKGGCNILSSYCKSCSRVWDHITIAKTICVCGSEMLPGHPLRAKDTTGLTSSPTVTVRLHGQARAPIKIQGQDWEEANR